MTSQEQVPNSVAYRQVRANVTQLLASDEAAVLVVPACPEWTVRDLLGHLVEVCGIMIGRLSGTPVPPDAAGLGIECLLDMWQVRGPRAERLIEDADGNQGGIGVMDAFTHELDLRHALGAPVSVDHPAYPQAIRLLINGLSRSIDGRGLPALCVQADGVQAIAGRGEPVATVSGEPLELYRSLAGRRAPSQITALRWSADPGQWLPAFTWGPFRPPRLPVE